MTDIRHLAQDLRAEAHTAPDKARDLMREAAGVLDRYKHLIGIARLGEEAAARPIPIHPPGAEPRRVKGAPCN